MKMKEVPPQLEAFASLIAAHPAAVQDDFAYCLCLLMVVAGTMRLVEIMPDAASSRWLFETTSGEIFSARRPFMSEEQESEVITKLANILNDDAMAPAGFE
jgi:hypothetical protein